MHVVREIRSTAQHCMQPICFAGARGAADA